jgi:CRP/FNR family transcriptional regulator, cyclic AMP receptor protein
MGTADDGGVVHIGPFTHELLAQHVGTSREVVTYYMNQFRNEGYIEYSRKNVKVRPGALRQWLLLDE